MSYQQPAPPVDRTVQGTLAGVEARSNGWMRFLIQEPDRQYPVKVDTKKPELIQAAMSLMNQTISAQIREQQSSNINEHTGQPYVNRYLNEIAPMIAGYPPGVYPPGTPTGPYDGAQQPMQQPQQPQPQYVQPQQPQTFQQPVQQQMQQHQAPPPQPGVGGFEKDLTIWRQTAAKVVAMSIDEMPEEQRNLRGMIAAAEAWVAYFVYGPQRFGLEPFSSQNGQQQSPLTGTRAYDGQQPEEAVVAAQAYGNVSDDQPCPECGFSGTHALGCSRNPYNQQ